MKKFLSLALVLLLAVLMVVPSFAALELENDKFENSFTLPSKYKDATHIKFVDFFEEGKTNARKGSSDKFNYVYLKEDGKGDFTVKFTVDETALYDFGISVMGWKKSVLRSTDVIIDDAKACYMGYDYVDSDQQKDHYFYGISAILEKGEHTLTLSLSDDFDDKNVKSLYITDFFYIAEEIPEAPAKADDPAASTKAPATFDALAAAAVVMAVSGAGVVVSKKRK